jgi:peptidoglycan/LPS O-acetylase OafA/YrhL
LKINGAYWSIAAEMQIYLVFPLYALLYRRLDPTMALLLVLLIGAALWVMGATGLPPNSGLHFLFAIGVSGAIMARSQTKAASILCDKIPLRHVCLAGGVIGLALAAADAANSSPTGLYLDFLIVVSFVGWLMLDQRRDTSLGRPFSLPTIAESAFSKIGIFAYSVYLIHEPLQQIIWQYAILPQAASKPAQFVALCVASVVVVIPVSFGFYQLFERPFLGKNALRQLLERFAHEQRQSRDFVGADHVGNLGAKSRRNDHDAHIAPPTAHGESAFSQGAPGSPIRCATSARIDAKSSSTNVSLSSSRFADSS